MQSRSNGVRTAAANLTSLERERRSKSAAPGRRAPARGEERSSRPPPPSVPSFGRLAQKGEGGCRCEARERGDWPARAEHHHPVRLASSPAGQRSGCRSRTRGFWTAAASEFLCLRPLGRRCGSFGIAVEGCRTGPDAARAGLLLTHPAVVHSARRAPSTPPPFWPEEALFQSMVWALGRSERSAFDVGHGQGMLDAEEAGLLPSPRERGQQHFPLFGS
eukprot:tig00000842_g4860.t1